MATLTFYQPADMLSNQVFWGTVNWATPSSIKISLSSYDYIIYYGSFTYDQSQNLSGGQLTRIVRNDKYYDSANYRYIYEEYVAEGFSVDAKVFESYIAQGDSQGAAAYIASGDDSIFGSQFSDTLLGYDGADSMYGRDGNDILYGGVGNDVINGGIGSDLSGYAATRSTIVAASQNGSGDVTIRTGFGTDILVDIEGVTFYDGTISVEDLINQYAPPEYQTSNGAVEAHIYTGAVDFLDFQLIVTDQGESVNGSIYNDFINLLGGDDAANGGGGRDVLDGGVGSNFLTGGAGNDVFFLDGRSGATTWSTITDFVSGDNVNIWGWREGVSRLLLAQENQGATGYKGATYHYDLNGDNLIDTSLTFSDLSLGAIPTPSPEEVAGNGYLLFA